jgi:coenzyme Q-binding protein COQ10
MLMPRVEYNRILPFSIKQLFDLVIDIESYPEFLPWCSASRIISKDPGFLIADLVIKFKIFREQYRSEVSFVPYSQVKTQAISGPFKYLYSEWNFKEILANSTEVSFYIDFELNVSFISTLTNILFEEASHKMLAAFEKRAAEIYI